MNETKAFVCPTCGAPLDYKGGEKPTIRCPYCETSLIVPEELRTPNPLGTPPKVTVVLPKELPSQLAAPEQIARRSIAAVLIAASASLVLIVGLVAALLMAGKHEGVPGQIPGLIREVAGGPGSVALTFGGEGTGLGLFQDARHIALDNEGNIYVGDYGDGRIQVFDPSGKFLRLWMVDRKTPLRGLAVDRQGTAYVVQAGEIKRYHAETGKYLDQIAYSEGWGFDDVRVAPDGGLLTAWYKSHDDIIRFDSQGKPLLTIRSAISGQSDQIETATVRVAMDGLGNIFALGEFNNAVFKFSPEGKYLNRFGGDGDQPGQFRAPLAIAVDGQGRVYVSDFKGIQIFDGEGRYLDLIRVDGPAYGMTINDHNELFVAAGKKVIEYEITLEAK